MTLVIIHRIHYLSSHWPTANYGNQRNLGCLPFYRKIRLGCRKHNGKQFTSLPRKYHIRYGLNPKKGEFVLRESGTEKEPRSLLMVSNIPFGLYQPE